MSAPVEQTGFLHGRNGTRLNYREWLVGSPRGIVSIVHGLGEHCGRYRELAGFLNRKGLSVRAHDLRGHGLSQGARGALESASDLGFDLKVVLDDFARQEGRTPFLLGHSLRGLVAAHFATEKQSALTGLILSSPALGIRLSTFQKMLLRTTARMAPSLRVGNGLDSGYLSHDPQVVEDYRQDPLNHGHATPRLVQYMQGAIGETLSSASGLTTPVLLLVAGMDRLVIPAGARLFFSRLPAGLGTLRWYDDSYHELFNETASRRMQVLNDLSDWFDLHLPP